MMLASLVRTASRLVNWVRLVGHRRHRRNVRQSRLVLERISGFEHEGAVLAYLRKVDPYVVEEIVLSLLERRGLFVLRNRSYSGDGGLDGRFWWPGQGWHAIQCKRYSSAINPAHAREFQALVKSSYRGGVLVHTGRTGEMSQEALAPAGLFILSGSTLTRCVKGADPLRLMTARKSARTTSVRASQSTAVATQ
ncbi:restriction system protein [Roseateles asaccharophilus]|uniref:restriction endonuclease n=1 Tax=Roseateles asaccharophilus TaxID=582607 RepID=UPI0038350C0C